MTAAAALPQIDGKSPAAGVDRPQSIWHHCAVSVVVVSPGPIVGGV
jgi:hypothetical protein